MTRHKVTRTVTTTTSETCWVELPDDHAERDTVDLDDLITDLACYVDVDEEVLDVLDSSGWNVIE